MKMKLSRSQWEMVGKKAGWIKEAAGPSGPSGNSFMNFDHKDPKNYAPGQTPYSDEEWGKVKKIIADAAEAEEYVSPAELEGESELKDDMTARRRTIKVTFSDGDTITTEINGTKKDIRKYYLPYGNKGEAQDYDINNPEKVRWPVSVEFLD